LNRLELEADHSSAEDKDLRALCMPSACGALVQEEIYLFAYYSYQDLAGLHQSVK
jgi:hypothetical protein